MDATNISKRSIDQSKEFYIKECFEAFAALIDVRTDQFIHGETFKKVIVSSLMNKLLFSENIRIAKIQILYVI